MDEGSEMPVAVAEREGQFVEPLDGWYAPGRLYHCIFPTEAAPVASGSGAATPQSK